MVVEDKTKLLPQQHVDRAVLNVTERTDSSHSDVPSDALTPAAIFAKARPSRRPKVKLPQCIAHRGYAAECPENTMLSFREALKCGAHAIETDIHLTKDDVVVLSHDATLERCFGKKWTISEHTWEEIRRLQTTATPHMPMPSLRELLELLVEAGNEDAWILLDIKLGNNAERVMRRIAETLREVGSVARPWESRVLLGIWAARYLPCAVEFLPRYPVVHQQVSISYARHFFDVPNVGFNMLLAMVFGPRGRKFIQECQRHDRITMAWTVNDDSLMRWTIRQGFDGVITDDPPKFLRTCEGYDEDAGGYISMRALFDLARTWVFMTVMLMLFGRKLLQPVPDFSLMKKRA